MAIAHIAVAASGGPVTVRVVDATHPQAVAGVIWRFSSPTERDGPVGQFGDDIVETALGAPAHVDGKFFLVDGNVLPFMDAPASLYQVTVTVLQDGKTMHAQVPPDGGVGVIGDKAKPFRYPFELSAK